MDLFYAYLKARAAANDADGAKSANEILHEAERRVLLPTTPTELKALMKSCTRLSAHSIAHLKSPCKCYSLANNEWRIDLLYAYLKARAATNDADGAKSANELLHEAERAQRAALHALTALCADHASLLPKVPAILKLLYDLDIVEEKAILEWASKPSKKYASKEVTAEVRKRAQPFLDWLTEAEEDSDEDGDEEEEDIEIEYDDRAKATPIKAQVAAPAPAKKDDDDGDIDVDIDAI
ncbi:eIF4-gamma/eIF5/eIF2-epsilon domain-containing protein [Phthorimaea operculella]|nr:eIF4-gamma/eIF5/eIF2-epsilon domain-containing protein [Phthorimaea operculella]